MKKQAGSNAAAVAGLVALLADRGIVAATTDASTPAPADPARADVTLTLTVDGVRHALQVEVKRRWSKELDVRLEHHSMSSNREPLLLLLPRIDASRRAWLRERGINYADMTGALSLRLPGVRIELDGAATRQWGTSIPAERQVNPFAKKASLVLRRFFETPRASQSVTALARDTGIAVGWAWDVSEELFQRGYIAGTGDDLHLADAASALVHWCAAYTWKKSRRRTFVVPYTQRELELRLADAWQSASMPWALTLLSGAKRRIGHVMHESATYLYALPPSPADLTTALAAVHATGVEAPVPETHSLCVLEPWYGRAAFIGVHTIDALPVVSDVQLFLDLVHYPVRGAEAAVHLLRSRIAPDLGMTAHDVARVEHSIG